jgi:predicted lipid-binding transport protein (Tim44 family)
MATAAPEARPRRTWGKKLGCLTALLVVGFFMLYTFASFDILPRRAFGRAHERIRTGQSLP